MQCRIVFGAAARRLDFSPPQRDNMDTEEIGKAAAHMAFMEIQEHFASIRARLAALGLWDERALVMLGQGADRAVFTAAGTPAAPEFFSAVDAPMAVFTAGAYSRTFVQNAHALRACTDDAAQMFGALVPCGEAPGGAAYLLPGQGFVVTGRFENELVAACILLEKMCMAALCAPRIGTLHPLDAALAAEEHTIYTQSYSRPALAAAEGDCAPPETACTADRALREAVIAYGRKLAEHRLIQATWGNVSVRIDGSRFLITPSGVDYARIRPEDVVEIRIADGSFPSGARPSSERRMHRLVYAARPDVHAVIHTHSAALQVFAACREGLRTPELDAPCAPYGVSGSELLAENAAAVLRSHSLCILANHGFTAVGDSLETALRRALDAERAAAALLV